MDDPSEVTGDPAQLDAPTGVAIALAAPVVGILRPQVGGERMVSASRGAFAVSLCVYLLVLAVLVPALVAWRATVRVEYATALDAAGQQCPIPNQGRWELKERTLAQVLRDEHQAGLLGHLEVLLLGTAAVSLAGIAVMGWLHIPAVHRGPDLWHSFKRSVRAEASCLGLAIVLVAVLGSYGVLVFQDVDRGALGQATKVLAGPEAPMMMAIAVLACVCLLLAWSGRAAAGARDASSRENLPPLCEDCGYDLTHRPEDGCCPECGGSVSGSLTPNGRRPGCRWQNRGRLVDWAHSSRGALTQPGVFYSTLKLRGPEGSWKKIHRFALMHYIAIACGAALWMFVCLIVADVPTGPTLLIPVFIALCAVVAGWCVLHAAGALTATAVFLAGTLPDPSAARKIVAFEAVFLWAFCLFNGLFLTSIMFLDVWRSGMLGSSMLGRFGIPAEELVCLGGNAAIFVAWLWRFGRAYRSVRWSNF